uniref:Uncharacterized protein n=1 Tax=Oryzias latipes TaxID=8090 RepID=A0A3P9I9G1_ORYLA
MDDEEDDMSRPVSQLWGTPFRDVKFQERAIRISAGEDVTAMPASQENSTDVPSCSFRWQPRMPFHGEAPSQAHHRWKLLPKLDPSEHFTSFSGNAGLRSHFPAQFEPMEDRGQIEEEEEEEEDRGQEDEVAERPEERLEVSVEVQIGRKLREIGDKFNQDHVEVVRLPSGDQSLSITTVYS